MIGLIDKYTKEKEMRTCLFNEEDMCIKCSSCQYRVEDKLEGFTIKLPTFIIKCILEE
jgi:hypothetical protein